VHQLPDFEAIGKMREAIYYSRWQSDLAKANECITQSLSFLPQLEDTLQIDLLGINAETYNNSRKYVEALKLGFIALEKAVTLNDPSRMAQSHLRITSTYRYLEDYEKAIRHATQALHLVEKHKLHGLKPRIHSMLARLYISSDQKNLAEHYVNEAFRWATLNRGSKRLFNQLTGELIITLCEKKNAPLLQHFMTHYRHNFFISPHLEFTDNFTLALAFNILGHQDSARLLLARAAALTHKSPGIGDYKRYLETAGAIALKENKFSEAAAYYKEGLEKGLQSRNPELLIDFSDSLKMIALKTGDYPAALQYDRISDSLKAEEAVRNSEDEIMRQEVAGLEAQKALEVKAAEDRKNQRNNLQYLGITAAIAGLFMMLLLMGMFQVSARTVRILSFFSFLLFFEFIFLIFKKKIAVYTGGEPLKDLAFMVALAALMVPLHHWAEHKAIHYLTHRKIGWGRKKPVAPAVSLTEPVKELHQ
jgi:tetratricopeptide (TPR) repeat protein